VKPPESAELPALQEKTFLVLIVTVSLAFGWILWPFYGTVFWAVVLAVVFSPLYRRLSTSMQQRRTLAALATVVIIVLVVILPLAIITGLMLQEGLALYERVQSGELSFSSYVQQIFDALPAWLTSLLDRYGVTTLSEVREKFSAGITKSIQFLAAHAVSVGQNAFDLVVGFFLMLYLLFFFLRDGQRLARRIRQAVPLQEELERNLFAKFVDVIRAAIKGNIVVAAVQGALGGVIFWFLDIHAAILWAVLMAFLSLLPAIGTALVWLPVAIYLLVAGEIWQGVVLIAFGVLVIGLVDNVLRPILVGKDTEMPDYLVLMSTLGGIAIFGLNGFVIGPVIAAMFVAVWSTLAPPRAVAEPSATDSRTAALTHADSATKKARR
jgi:predicted PurR-regulated permease PerM